MFKTDEYLYSLFMYEAGCMKDNLELKKEDWKETIIQKINNFGNSLVDIKENELDLIITALPFNRHKKQWIYSVNEQMSAREYFDKHNYKLLFFTENIDFHPEIASKFKKFINLSYKNKQFFYVITKYRENSGVWEIKLLGSTANKDDKKLITDTTLLLKEWFENHSSERYDNLFEEVEIKLHYSLYPYLEEEEQEKISLNLSDLDIPIKAFFKLKSVGIRDAKELKNWTLDDLIDCLDDKENVVIPFLDVMKDLGFEFAK